MVLKFFLLLFSFLPLANHILINAKPSVDSLLSKNIINKSPKYSLGPGDLLRINLYKFENLSSKVTILPDGTVNLPRINSLYLNNLSLDEANSLITERYKQIIKNPIVYIDLIKARPIRINVNGEVQRPGIYSLNTKRMDTVSNSDGGEAIKNYNEGWPTVVDAIQKAGGLTTEANLRKIKLRRLNKEDGNIDEIVINFWESLFEGKLIDNYVIFDGDSIYIENSQILNQEEKTFISSTNLAPSTISVKVIGEVKNPGRTSVRSNSPIMEGVLNAGGFTNRSNRKKITLLRLNNNGNIQKKTFLNDNSGKENIFLKDRDVIFVDDSALSKTSNNLKNIVEPIKPIIDAATLYKIFFD